MAGKTARVWPLCVSPIEQPPPRLATGVSHADCESADMIPTALPAARKWRPFMAMDVLREAAALERQGRRIIHMEVGEPAAPPPLAVREAAIAALAAGRVGYTEALGLPSLRRRSPRSYRDLYGLEVPAERIAVTTGSSGGFILAFLACFDPGARIAISEPGYPAYRNLLEALGLEPVALPVSASTRFAVTAEMIEAAHRGRGLDGVLLMSPGQPLRHDADARRARRDLRDMRAARPAVHLG